MVPAPGVAEPLKLGLAVARRLLPVMLSMSLARWVTASPGAMVPAPGVAAAALAAWDRSASVPSSVWNVMPVIMIGAEPRFLRGSHGAAWRLCPSPALGACG